MKNIILVVCGIVAIGFGITAYYFPSLFARDDQFAHNFVALIEEIVPQLEWPTATAIPRGSDTVKIPILVYHSMRPPYVAQTKIMREYNVSPPMFERQLRFLKDNGYSVISFRELANYFMNRGVLPPKSVILTFDDGWRSQYRYAFPLLKKFGFTATFFVYTNAIGKKHFLAWAQIKEMAAAGMTIGAHTKSHPYLVGISKNTAQLHNEIIGGKKVLEEHLGTPVEFFAYPFGHYNDEVLAVVKEAGFVAARSTYPGVYQTRGGIYKLFGNEVTENFDKFTQALMP